jgi:MinD-like ATPase involved in chromosome partitioning or flagellar assembly
VFDPGEPAGRDHLLAMGVDRVIESEAPMSAFLEALLALAPVEAVGVVSDRDLRRLVDEPIAAESDSGATAPVVVGGPPGGGATEISIELARAASSHGEVVLVDADDVLPSIAQRLALPIEPNLRTAVDAVEYGMGELTDAFCAVPGGSFPVLCGLPNVAAWSQVRPGEVIDVLDAIARRSQTTVVVNVASRVEDLVVSVGRTRYGVTRAVLGHGGTVVGVGSGNPVGVTRLLGWVAEVRALTDASLHLVVNESPVDGFRRAEIADEIHRTYPPAGLWFVPHDEKVGVAAWAGELVGPGAFTRAVSGLGLCLTGPGVGAARARNGGRRQHAPRPGVGTR